MKRTTLASLLLFCFIIISSSYSLAERNFDPKLKINSSKDYSKEIFSKDYNAALKMHKKIAGSFIGASIDFQVGYGTTSANVSEKSNSS